MIALVVVGVLVLLVLTGLVAARRHYGERGGDYTAHVRAADAALERARAADKGWDREALHRAARDVLATERPGRSYDDVHLVRVDDRAGIEEDRAHLVAVGPEGEATVVLTRHEGAWIADRVE